MYIVIPCTPILHGWCVATYMYGPPYLQCTTRGPWLSSTVFLTVLTKSMAAVGVSGTPWSGQDVNW